jgi:hypothetical protein
MGILTNQFVSQSYQGLLNLANANTGLTTNLQTVTDGLGGTSPLQISKTQVNISGSLTVNGSPISFDSSSLVTTSSFNAYTSSNDSKVNSLIAATGSYASQTGVTALSSSIAVTDLNQNNIIAGLATTSSLTSLSSSIAITDLSQNNRLTSIEGITGSFATTSSLTSLSSSIAVTDLAQNNRLSSLEINSGSQQLQINQKLDTGSFNTYSGNTLNLINTKLDSSSFNSYTSSNDGKVNDLISKTGSYATTGSNVFRGNQTISGSLNVTGSITALSASITYLETVFQTSSVIFSSGSNILGDAAGDTQTLWGRVAIPTGPVSVTGSVTATNFTGSLQGTASYATQALSASYAPQDPLPAGVVSGSQQIVDLGFATTSSVNTKLDTGSFNTYSGDTLNLINQKLDTGSFNSYTSSNDGKVNSLIAATGSYVTETESGSFMITGSVSGPTSTFTKGDGSQFSLTVNNVQSASQAQNANTASFALNGGVTQILAGPNIIVSPLNGQGQVTISSTGTGTGSFNTATGSYGSFYDTTIQPNPVANTPNSMSFNETAITNGVSISGSISPFNTYIKTEDAGIYNIQFSAQVEKTDSGTDEIDIWIRKNGNDLLDTATKLTLQNNNTKVVAAWNWFVQSATNDYYQLIWSSADTGMRLFAEPSSSLHPGIPSVIATANRVDQFLSNTGSFTGSFIGSFTGSLEGTASFATNALSASYAPSNPLPSGIVSGSQQIVDLGFATTSSVNQKLDTGSFNTYTASMDARTGSYATTGSNRFNGNQTITGSVFISGSAGILLEVDDTIKTRRIHFDKNPFNNNPSSNLGAIRLDNTNKLFYITNYDTAEATTSSWVNLFVDTGSNRVTTALEARNGGTIAEIQLSNLNGYRAISSNVEEINLSGNLAYTGSMIASGSSRFIGNQTTTGSVIISGSSRLIGNQTITGSVVMSGSAGPELIVIGDTIITGSVIMSGSAGVELDVKGDTTITGSVNISGSLGVIGNTSINTITPNTVKQNLVLLGGVNNLSSSTVLNNYLNAITTSLSNDDVNFAIMPGFGTFGPSGIAGATGSVFISGSNNLILNLGSITPVANGRRQTIGSQNIVSSFPNINTSSLTIPTINGNYNAGAMVLTLTTGSSAGNGAHNFSSNINLGQLFWNHPSASIGVAQSSLVTTNINVGNINSITNGPILLTTAATFQSNINSNPAVNLNHQSSSITFTNNIVGGNTITVNNRYFQTGSNNSLAISANIFGGQGITVNAAGSPSTNVIRTVVGNLIGGQTVNVSLEATGVDAGGLRNSLIYGQGLNVSGSHSAASTDRNNITLLGRWNGEDNGLADSARTVFAVGTGTATGTRRTSLYVTSGSLVGVSGSFDVKGNTIVTGSMTLSGSIGPELIVVGDTIMTGSLTTSGSLIVTGSIASTRSFGQVTLASNQSIPTTTDTTVNFDTTDFDPNSWWNNTTKVFTPTVAGYYEFTAEILLGTGTGTGQMNIQLNKNNGTQVFIGQSTLNTSQPQTLLASRIVFMNGSTDNMKVTFYTDASAGQTVTGGNGTLFNIKLL